MKFNIICEDGGVFQNAIILTQRGIAGCRRDVFCALKYEGAISICNKYYMNYLIESKDVYEVEEVPKLVQIEQKNDSELVKEK